MCFLLLECQIKMCSKWYSNGLFAWNMCDSCSMHPNHHMNFLSISIFLCIYINFCMMIFLLRFVWHFNISIMINYHVFVYTYIYMCVYWNDLNITMSFTIYRRTPSTNVPNAFFMLNCTIWNWCVCVFVCISLIWNMILLSKQCPTTWMQFNTPVGLFCRFSDRLSIDPVNLKNWTSNRPTDGIYMK